MQYSAEQLAIIDFWSDLDEDRHAVVNAKAGCGKTTIAVECGRQVFETKKFHTLLLTYSTMLKLDARKKVQEDKNLRTFIQVESYHSAVANLFGFKCMDQYTLELFLTLPDPRPIEDLGDIGLLILDEAQDLTDTFVTLVHKIRSFLSPGHRLLLLGDRFQNIFQALHQSSPAYMDHPESHFGGTFWRASISTSFRITNEMAMWINKYLNPVKGIAHHFPQEWSKIGTEVTEAWGTGIHAHPSAKGPPVDFHQFNLYQSAIPSVVCETIREHVRKYGKDSVMVLVHSCKITSRHPATRLINQLGDRQDWIVLDGEFRETDELLLNKGVVATPYKMKGRENSLVVFLGLDAHLERDPPLLAFAIAYVACTRARTKLVIVGHEEESLFFTMRTEPPLAVPRHVTALYRQKRVDIKDLANFAPFKWGFDNMATLVVGSLVLDENKLTAVVPGRLAGTFEATTRWYSEAVRLAIPDELAPSASNQTWVTRVDSLIKSHAEETQTNFTERQFPDASSWVECEKLDAITDRAVGLLSTSHFAHLGFQAFEFKQHPTYNKVVGNIFLNFGRGAHIIHFAFTENFEQPQGQHAILAGALTGIPDTRVYVLNPIAGELREVIGPVNGMTKLEYLKSIVQRKHLLHLLS